MDDLQHEKEQIEEIRAWWAEYGRYVIAGVVLAVAGLVGWNQYQSSKFEAQAAASDLFESLTVHVDGGDLDEAQAVAAELAIDYANTAYAAQSRLAMARLYMDKNRDQDAADVLGELLAMRGNDELRAVGKQRLARILLYQDKPQEAVELLEGDETAAFASLYAESLGDAYAALGDVDKAAEAYRVALADTTQTINRGVVQMKLLDLPEAAPEAAPETAPEAEAEADSETEEDDAEASSEEEGEETR
ncbi:MAG: tetratricopeptide repeat protein [Woeseiaceae bacterium]|nr:tetratricopeptide repeat protein [Woeseiaceae bacterium]